MCQEKCPVKINTGELIKAIRAEDMSKQTTASNLAMVSSCLFCSHSGVMVNCHAGGSGGDKLFEPLEQDKRLKSKYGCPIFPA